MAITQYWRPGQVWREVGAFSRLPRAIEFRRMGVMAILSILLHALVIWASPPMNLPKPGVSKFALQAELQGTILGSRLLPEQSAELIDSPAVADQSFGLSAPRENLQTANVVVPPATVPRARAPAGPTLRLRSSRMRPAAEKQGNGKAIPPYASVKIAAAQFSDAPFVAEAISGDSAHGVRRADAPADTSVDMPPVRTTTTSQVDGTASGGIVPATPLSLPGPAFALASPSAPEAAATDAAPSSTHSASSSGGIPPPRTGEIRYLASRGTVSADAVLTWNISEEGHYRLRLEIKDAKFGSEIVSEIQASEGHVTPRGLVPRSYAAETKGSKHTAAFDWVAHQLKLSQVAGDKFIPLLEDTQDSLSVILQFSFQPPSNSFPTALVTDGDQVAHYSWRAYGEELLTLNNNTFQTLHLGRQRTGDEAGIEVWLSLEHHYLPVQIVYSEVKGETNDLRLSVSAIRLSSGH